MADGPALTLCEVLEAEYQSLHNGPPPGPRPKDAAEQEKRLAALRNAIHHSTGPKQSALCLSGGGIRSATFSLGVLRGLAERGLLERFDYLSTVSGGGYIGSWLSAWIHREGPIVFQKLRQPDPVTHDGARPVHHLREYSHYLDPKLGLFSADTWTLAATVARNLILNWLVLLPLLAAMLMLPRLQVTLAVVPRPEWLKWAMLGFAAVFLIIGIRHIGQALPGSGRRPLATRGFLVFVWTTVLMSAECFALAWSWSRHTDWSASGVHWSFYFWMGVTLHVLGWLFVNPHSDIVAHYRYRTWIVVMVSGGLGGIGLWLLAVKIFPYPAGLAFACWSVPALLLNFTLAACIYIGWSSFWTSDADREWLARTGGWLLLAIAVIAATNVLVIYGVDWLMKAAAWIKASVGALGILSGWAARQLGKSANSPANGGPPSKSAWLYVWVPKVAALLFLIFVLVALCIPTNWLLVKISPAMFVMQKTPKQPEEIRARWVAPDPDMALRDGITGRLEVLRARPPKEGQQDQPQFIAHEINWRDHSLILRHNRGLILGISLVLLAAVGYIMGFAVNVNKFSLHAMYRDRLIRAYLGASRKREPDPFTGFDRRDNFPIHKLRGQRPLHVLNMALNTAGGKELAEQERKAQSFTVTALHTGSWQLCACEPGSPTGRYRASEDYASYPDRLHRPELKDYGISIGAAMAISGAAANPNMGYNSSPLVAFLMTLLNARLGAWVGNPGDVGTGWLWRRVGLVPPWQLTAPSHAVLPLLAEALSLTNDAYPYVNISDGGHFENLALYEMVLRRCRFILVLDNGQDPDYTFESLANAMRKIRTDLNVEIQIDFQPLVERKTHFVEGEILYSTADEGAHNGKLVLLKPVLTGDESADIYNYYQQDKTFPQQTTADQWFSESQFESYRMLGYHSTEDLPVDRWLQYIHGRY